VRRLEAGKELQRRLAKVGFAVDDGLLSPGRRESRLEPGRRLAEVWDVLVDWARVDVDLGPHALGDDDLLLFEAFLDLAPSAKHREDRPAFVLAFKRQLEFREEPEGAIVAESVVWVYLAFSVDVAPIDLDSAGPESFVSTDSFWHGGGSEGSNWQPAVEATRSFQAARDHTIWAGTFESYDEA
jgi:hypothetical protein